MGYYGSYRGYIVLPEENRAAALQALKDLNHRHELKTGGSFPSTADPYECRWFAWMPGRYHETVTSVKDVLELVGFEVIEGENGWLDLEYDSKVGAERHFLNALAPFVTEGSLAYEGEESGDIERLVFAEGELNVQRARIVFD